MLLMLLTWIGLAIGTLALPAQVFGPFAVDGLTAFTALVSGVINVLLLLVAPPREPRASSLLATTVAATALAASVHLAVTALAFTALAAAAVTTSTGWRTRRIALLWCGAGAITFAASCALLYAVTQAADVRDLGARVLGVTTTSLVLALLGWLLGLVFLATAPARRAPTAPATAAAILMVPLIGGTMGLVRLLVQALPGDVGGWSLVCGIVAVALMTSANLRALRAPTVLAILAWLGASQFGLLLALLAAGTRIDPLASIAVQVCLGTALGFTTALGAVAALGDGVSGAPATRGAPWRAAALALGFASIAGVPPLGGFLAKRLVIEAVLAAELPWLAALVAVNLILGAAATVRASLAVLRERGGRSAAAGEWHAGLGLGLAASCTIAIGVFTTAMTTLAERADQLAWW